MRLRFSIPNRKHYKITEEQGTVYTSLIVYCIVLRVYETTPGRSATPRDDVTIP